MPLTLRASFSKDSMLVLGFIFDIYNSANTLIENEKNDSLLLLKCFLVVLWLEVILDKAPLIETQPV